MTSTTGLVDEMLGSLRDQEADVDKKTLAMKNLVNITSNKAGSESVIKKGGLKEITRFLCTTIMYIMYIMYYNHVHNVL